jgi:hypothetical protein
MRMVLVASRTEAGQTEDPAGEHYLTRFRDLRRHRVPVAGEASQKPDGCHSEEH